MQKVCPRLRFEMRARHAWTPGSSSSSSSSSSHLRLIFRCSMAQAINRCNRMEAAGSDFGRAWKRGDQTETRNGMERHEQHKTHTQQEGQTPRFRGFRRPRSRTQFQSVAGDHPETQRGLRQHAPSPLIVHSGNQFKLNQPLTKHHRMMVVGAAAAATIMTLR